MTETSIRTHTARPSDLAQIAELIARQNSSPRHRCLHSDEGSVEGVLLTMNKLAGQGSLAFVCVRGESDRVIAAFVAEIDSDLRRGWLWGPFAEGGETDPEGWLTTCEQMYGRLMAALPFEPVQLDGFIDQSFELGAKLYEACGHRHAETNYVFVAVRPAVIVEPPQGPSLLIPEFVEGFVSLFDAVFPNTFYTGSQVVDRLNEHEQVFVYTQDREVLGFCHASTSEGAKEGYIEFVGVDAGHQGRGIGKQLLQASMHWLFTEQNMPKIGLSTGDNNFQAHALYRGLGFELEYTGLSYRKRSVRGAR